jgi:hypothetical protein
MHAPPKTSPWYAHGWFTNGWSASGDLRAGADALDGAAPKVLLTGFHTLKVFSFFLYGLKKN